MTLRGCPYRAVPGEATIASADVIRPDCRSFVAPHNDYGNRESTNSTSVENKIQPDLASIHRKTRGERKGLPISHSD
jgi:hypothetical protein